MKKLFLLVLCVSLLVPFTVDSKSLAQGTESESGAVVCSPNVYFTPPDDCLPTGPSTYLTDMAKLGLTFPPRPLTFFRPDPGLTKLPYYYFHLDKDTVPVLNGPAGTASGQSYLPGFVYVSYVDRVDTGHGIYYMLPSGGWIPGKGARVGEYSIFQGLQFNLTPNNSFAWPLPFYTNSVPVRSAPSYNAPLTDKIPL